MMLMSLLIPAVAIWSTCIFTVYADIRLEVATGTPMPLETGTTITLVCTGNNVTRHGIEVHHNGRPLCTQCEIADTEMMEAGKFQFVFHDISDNFLLFIFVSNSTEEDSGEYTCRTGQSESSIEIRVAELSCDAGLDGPLEFLVGENVELSCYNPFQSEASWLDDGGSVLPSDSTTSPSAHLNITTSTVILGLDNDLDTFKCFLRDESSNPCTIGPIRVSPYIEIASSDGKHVKASIESISFTCHVIPENNDTWYQWKIDDWMEDSSWVVSDDFAIESTLSLHNLSLSEGDVINVTCEGFFRNSTLIADYSVTVIRPYTGLFLAIIIVSSTLVMFLAILVTIPLCCYVFKRLQRKTLTFTDKYPSVEVDRKLDEKPTGVILNRYDRDPTELAGNNGRDTILTRLPDGRLQLQERKLSIISACSHSSGLSETSLHSSAMTGELYDEPPPSVDADASSLQEIYDEAPATRRSVLSEDIPRPLSVLLPREHNTPSFRRLSSDRPISLVSNDSQTRPTNDDGLISGDLPPVSEEQLYEEEPMYSSVKKPLVDLSSQLVPVDDQEEAEGEDLYDECEEEDDYAAIS